MAVTLTTLVTEVQARCNALTGSSTISAVIDVAIAAKKVEQAGGILTRTTLDTQIQRVVNLSGGGSQIEDLIALAAANEVAAAGGSTRVIKKYQVFSTAGSFTWTRPANLNGTLVYVTQIGGGSSGSSGIGESRGNGGSAGEFHWKAPYDLGAATSATVIVGAGGAASASDTAANAGNPTSFGSLVCVGGYPPPYNGSFDYAARATPTWLGGQSLVSTATPLSYEIYLPKPLPCPWAAPVNINTVYYRRVGASGLLIPGVALIRGGDCAGIGTGGVGFGAGGGGSNIGGSSGAGARGFVLVEWEEYV